MTPKVLLLPALVAVFSTSLAAADWPQYRGPHSDGSTQDSLATPESIADKANELWRVAINTGFSSFAVAEGMAFTIVRRELDGLEQETLIGLDAVSGKEKWARAMSLARYGHDGGNSGASGNKGGDGPRSTPAVSDGLVVAIDADLVVRAFQVKDGQPAWSHSVEKEFSGRNIKWKNAASPLIDGDHLFMAGGGPGESFLAFNKRTGNLAWKSGNALMTHATPIAVDLHDVRQIIFFSQKGLHGLNAADGVELWHYPFKFATSTAASPVVFGDIVYCSAGYGVGSAAIKVTQSGGSFEVEELWRERGNGMANHWSTPVCKDGYLYGLFGFKKYGEAPLACYDIRTGEQQWERKGFGPGHLIRMQDQVLVLGDSGQLVVALAKPDKYHELSRAEILTGKCWTTPVLASGKVYARSTKEAVCIDVSGK